MSKKSILARQLKREELVSKYKTKREKLKKEGNYQALDNLPKNASPVRLANRCWRCGRKRFFIRHFGTCRICFRELASEGKIPGVCKVSS